MRIVSNRWRRATIIKLIHTCAIKVYTPSCQVIRSCNKSPIKEANLADNDGHVPLVIIPDHRDATCTYAPAGEH